MGRSAFIREIIVFLLLPHPGSAQGAGEYVYIPDAKEVRTARISGFRIYLVEENGVRLRHDSLQQVYLFDTLGNIVRNVRYFQESQVIYRYEDGGEKVEMTWKDIDPMATDSSATVYRYDRDGNQLENYSTTSGPGTGTRYVYETGRLVETHFYGRIATSLYDTLGHRIAELTFQGDEFTRGELYTWDSTGNEIGFCMLNDDSVAYACHLNTYDDRGQLIRNRIIQPGRVVSRKEMAILAVADPERLGHEQLMFEYIRNEHGFIVEVRSHRGSEDEVVKVVRFEYDYRPTPGAGMD